MKGLVGILLLLTTGCATAKNQINLVDYFLPMQPQGPLVSEGIWGCSNAIPRDIRNGLEDSKLENWCYWDGRIVRDDEDKFHIYASRWPQSMSHSEGWHLGSRAMHAVSDDIMGPYRDLGMVYPDWMDGLGHNVIGLRMHDGRYAVVTSEVTTGEVFAAESPYGPFELLGQIRWDANGFDESLCRYNKNGRMSNVKILLRPDGRYMLVPRSTAVMISENGILGPYKVMHDRVYKNYPGLPQTKNEDPTVWYSGGMYHMVYNHWPTKTSHHFSSLDGITDWKYRGIAFKKEESKIFRYTDGTVNDWQFVERPTAYVDEKTGHVTHFIFSVIDVKKGQDRANDNHASKIVVVPFDGKAFDRDMQKIVAAEKTVKAEKFRYEPDWDSIRSHYQVPEWFRDAKFGIFLHWGPYTVPAYGVTKYPKYMYYKNWKTKKGEPLFQHHIDTYGPQSEFGYKDFIPMFKAEKFNAGAWVKLFKEAGAKYIVPVAEHHDGFAMYNSHFTDFNVVKMGPKRDTMRELADAARAAGLKFGCSSHLANNRRYYSRKDPSWDTNDPADWQLYWKNDEPKEKPSPGFLDWWWKRTTDIIDQYQPDLLWFDFGIDKPGWESVHKPILAYYYNKGLEWGKEVVLQDKNMNKTSRVNGVFHHDTSVKSFPEDLIVLDLERGRMDGIREFSWQTDTATSKDTWSYVEGQEFKTSNYLLDELIDIVSKNGNLLLNVGPKSDGTITEEETAILKEMGAWLKLNGEAIYDTRPWKIFGEGPTKVSAGSHSEQNNAGYVPADIRFTTKGDTLYVTALAWPEDGVFTIKSLAAGNPYESRTIKSVEFISGKNSNDWKQTVQGLEISMKGKKPCEAAYAFRVQFKN